MISHYTVTLSINYCNVESEQFPKTFNNGDSVPISLLGQLIAILFIQFFHIVTGSVQMKCTNTKPRFII